MALKKLTAALPERTDPADATLIYRDEPLRFARPRVANLQPTREQLDAIGRNFPGLRPDQLLYVHIMGAGYIPEPGEGAMVAWKEFATIAQSNDLAFADLVRQWESAFPEFTNWTAARFSAKNDSRAQEDSDTASPTLPPVLDDSPQSLGN
jgi:hypothetical protein